MNTTTQRQFPLLEAVFSDITKRSAKLLSGYATWRQRRAVYRQTLSELSALSARELADIGIPRAHIRRVALESARKA